MRALVLSAIAPFRRTQDMKTNDIKPPPPIPPREFGNFLIKVTTYDGDKKKFTGYGRDSDIIPKTMEYCNKMKCGDNACSRPVVTTSPSTQEKNYIVVENISEKSSYVHFV